MDFGLGLMGYSGCWDDAAFAEEHGFATAGFVDSPLLGGDPFVVLGLAAEATSAMRIGTFLAVPSNRIAASTASAIATVNKLAPGRTFLAMGTGYTARNTFGLPPVPARRLQEYAMACRSLLAGEETEHREGDRVRQIKFRHKPGDYIEVDPPVPVYLAADGPKALAAVGEAADGWVTTLQFSNVMENSDVVFAESLAAVQEAARGAGREGFDPYTIWSTGICILEEGESAISPRALRQVGAYAMMPFHSYSDKPAIGEFLPPPVQERLDVYEREVLARFDRDGLPRHQEAHRGHLSHLLDGEAAVLTEEIVRMTTLTGTAEEIADRLRALDSAGLRNVSFWIPPDLTREVVVQFESEVMPRLAGATVDPSTRKGTET